MNNYQSGAYQPETPFFDNRNNFQSYNYPPQQHNYYQPPNINYPQEQNVKRNSIPTMEMLNLNNEFPSPGNSNKDFQKLTTKIHHVDSNIMNLGNYSSVLWMMMIWSCICLFWSFFTIGFDDFIDHPGFEKVNLIVNLIYVVGYHFGIQGHTQQSKKKTKQFQLVLIGFLACGIVYFLVFMFVGNGFFRYLWNLIFLAVNCSLYYMNVELVKLYKEKKDLRKKLDRAYI